MIKTYCSRLKMCMEICYNCKEVTIRRYTSRCDGPQCTITESIQYGSTGCEKCVIKRDLEDLKQSLLITEDRIRHKEKQLSELQGTLCD